MSAAPAPAAEPRIQLVDGAQVEGSTRLVDECYDYTDADQIGEGTYGKVYRGTDIAAGDKVALKMIRMDNEKEGFPITAIREIKLLSTLKHENIVNLREIVRSRVNKESKYKGDIFMVFDYAEHDLTGMMDAVKHKGGMSVPQIKCVMQQLLKGLSYCHQNGILHRDLKASNLLINKRGVLKIADFGLARNYASDNNDKLTNRVITLWYRPPELLLGTERYGPEVDVWSVGCIFAELLAKKPLFPGNNEQQQLDCIFKLMGAPSEENWPGVSALEFFSNVKTSAYKKGPEGFDAWCRSHQVHQEALPLLKAMLQLDPAKRISALDASLHPYFYDTKEPPCKPSELPRLPDCHEWTTKKRRHSQAQHHQGHSGHGHGSHGHHHAAAGAGHGYMGHQQHAGGMVAGHPGGAYGGHMPGPAAAAAAAAAAGGMHGGYGGGRGPPDARNVRPRTSGGGAGPPGPYGAGQPPPLGYNPSKLQQPQQRGPPGPYGQQPPPVGYQGPPQAHAAPGPGWRPGGYGQQQQQQQQPLMPGVQGYGGGMPPGAHRAPGYQQHPQQRR